MGQGAYLTDDKIARIRQLFDRGISRYRISGMVGVCPKTVRKYTNGNVVTLNKKTALTGNRRTRRGTRQFDVHPEIARLRDQLMAEWRPGGDHAKAQRISLLLEQLLPMYHPRESRPTETLDHTWYKEAAE